MKFLWKKGLFFIDPSRNWRYSLLQLKDAADFGQMHNPEYGKPRLMAWSATGWQGDSQEKAGRLWWWNRMLCGHTDVTPFLLDNEENGKHKNLHRKFLKEFSQLNLSSRKDDTRKKGTHGSDKPTKPGTCKVLSQREKRYSGLSARRAQRTGMCKSPSTEICSILRWLSLKPDLVLYIAKCINAKTIFGMTEIHSAPGPQGTCHLDKGCVRGRLMEGRSKFHTQHAVTGRLSLWHYKFCLKITYHLIPIG